MAAQEAVAAEVEEAPLLRVRKDVCVVCAFQRGEAEQHLRGRLDRAGRGYGLKHEAPVLKYHA
jgi:hypothetical protein